MILQKEGGQVGKIISHYPPVADNVRAKHSKEEFLKNLRYMQKNASPLQTLRWGNGFDLPKGAVNIKIQIPEEAKTNVYDDNR